jgi:CheY-like chemotaxis protein
VKKLFLLADDDHDDSDMFREALTKVNPPVDFHHVEDGKAVFQYLDNTQNPKPDIIFLDLNMPKIDGWQCLTDLKNISGYKGIPVVIYSTSSHARDKENAVRLGASGFLTKPDDFKLLVKILTNIATDENRAFISSVN